MIDRDLRERLINVLLVLLIVLAVMFLAQMVWQWLGGFADLLLLFVLGWLVSFILNPAVMQLSQSPLFAKFEPPLKSILGQARGGAVAHYRFSRQAAVMIVYLALVLLIIVAVAALAPTAIAQLSALASHLPEYVDQIPEVSTWAQTQLARIGIRVNVGQAMQNGLTSLQDYAATIIQNALGIFTGLLGLLGNLFFVVIIGFILTMDGPRLRQAVLRQVPQIYNDEVRFFSQSVDRTFGGFLRGQLIQSILMMVGTALVMTIFGLNFVLIASLFAGLFMLIPLIGPLFAILPPTLVVIFQAPEATLWLLIILFVYQTIIVNVLMPRLLSDSLGLHPLLVFAAILISVRVAGFWGAFFGIPVAGVLWAMGLFFFGRWQTNRSTGGEPERSAMD